MKQKGQHATHEQGQRHIARSGVRATQMAQVLWQHAPASNKNMPDAQPRQGMGIGAFSLSSKAMSTPIASIRSQRPRRLH